MSSASRKSSRRTNEAAPDLRQQFSEEVLAEAKQIADRYSVVLEPHERLGIVGRSLEMPTVFADGSTPARCMKAVREALMAAVATMLAAGERPPAPASEGLREFQVNIRLTAEEKLLLEQAAKQRGYRGISDYMRSTALTDTRRSA